MTLPKSVQRAQVEAAGVRNYCEPRFAMSVNILVTAIPEEEGGGYATQTVVTGKLEQAGTLALLSAIIDAHQLVGRSGQRSRTDIPGPEQVVLGRLAAVTLGEEAPKAQGDA